MSFLGGGALAVGIPRHDATGSSPGHTSHGISAKGKETCLPCHCIWGGLSPPLPQVLLAPSRLSPDKMEERNSVSEV